MTLPKQHSNDRKIGFHDLDAARSHAATLRTRRLNRKIGFHDLDAARSHAATLRTLVGRGNRPHLPDKIVQRTGVHIVARLPGKLRVFLQSIQQMFQQRRVERDDE
jgi:hypothetical protein